jgi:multidrug resistance efflux pump
MEMKRQKDQLELDKERTTFQLDSMKAAAEVKKAELEIKQKELAIKETELTLQTKELEIKKQKQVFNTSEPTPVADPVVSGTLSHYKASTMAFGH